MRNTTIKKEVYELRAVEKHSAKLLEFKRHQNELRSSEIPWTVKVQKR